MQFLCLTQHLATDKTINMGLLINKLTIIVGEISVSITDLIGLASE